MLADEGTPAVERYLELLAAGGSDYPLDLLRRAGVDLATPEPVRAALAEFAAIVDEMERLVEAGALEAGNCGDGRGGREGAPRDADSRASGADQPRPAVREPV